MTEQSNTTPQTIDPAKFDRMVSQARKAKQIWDTSFGEPRSWAARNKIEGLCATAERLGVLEAFTKAVMA